MGGQFEIEARIVDEYESVRPIFRNGAFGLFQIAEYLSEMAQYLAERHERHVAVMDQRRASRGAFRCGRRHLVAAEVCELCLRVDLA